MEPGNVLLNLQIPRSVRKEFRIAAKLKGTSMSSLVHQFIVRTIREEKERAPQAFPDFVPDEPPEIVGEVEIERRIKAITLERFGSEITDAQLNALITAVKTLTEVIEVSAVVVPIESAKDYDPKAVRMAAQQMIDTADISVPPRKRKAS